MWMEAASHQRRAPTRQNDSRPGQEALRTGPGTHSSPLPQTEWPYAGPLHESSRRRGQRQTPYEQQYAPYSSREFDSRAGPVDYNWRQRPSARMRNRRRSHELFLFEEQVPSDQQATGDFSPLYPEIDPYDNRWSTHSAPDELEHNYPRSADPNNMPGYMLLSSPDDTSLVQMPRNSTYLPVNVTRRAHRTMSSTDTAFADVDDFHLFVQATAGLRPEESFSDPPRESLVPAPLFATARVVHTVQVDPPEWEESGTRRAIQHLALMPESYQSSGREVPQLVVPDFDPRPPVIRASTVTPEISPVEPESSDEELPNYAESQAEAQARQRYEAARRAEELRRRWQQTGARRGFEHV